MSQDATASSPEPTTTDSTPTTTDGAAPEATPSAPVLDLSGSDPGEKPAADGQPGQEAQPNASEKAGDTPLSYEPFTLPDGYEIQDEDLNAFTAVLSEIKADDSGRLDQDSAQKLIDLFVTVDEARRQHADQQAEADSQALRSEWQESLRSHPELGGDRLQQTQANVNMVAPTMPAETQQFLSDTGLLFHPAVIPWLNRLGQMMQESPVTFGGATGSGDQRTPAQRMYAKSGHQ